MSWAVSAVALFMAVMTVVAVGATALIGGKEIAAADPRGSTAYLLGARAAFGPDLSRPESLLFTTVTTAIFLTLLASVASMTLACANSLAHDVVVRAGTRPLREMALARLSALAVGVPVIALAVLAQHRSLQPLAILSFCLGASAIAPALVFSLFWRRFTRAGLLCTLIGGSLSVVVLMTGTNLVSGSPQSAFPEADFNWFPFTTPPLWCRFPWGSCAGCWAPCCRAGGPPRGSAAATRRSSRCCWPGRRIRGAADRAAAVCACGACGGLRGGPGGGVTVAGAVSGYNTRGGLTTGQMPSPRWGCTYRRGHRSTAWKPG